VTTVGALRAELANLDAGLDIRIVVNGHVVPVAGVVSNPGSPFAVVRGKGKPQPGNRYTIDEDGVLGLLAEFGLTDQQIGEVLSRSPDSIRRKRKTLGC